MPDYICDFALRHRSYKGDDLKRKAFCPALKLRFVHSSISQLEFLLGGGGARDGVGQHIAQGAVALADAVAFTEILVSDGNVSHGNFEVRISNFEMFGAGFGQLRQHQMRFSLI